VVSPVAWFLISTCLNFVEIAVTSHIVRTSTLNTARNICSVATSRLDSSGMTPDTWYGNPQLAYDTYGPRSSMTISACSSNRRNRAAHDAPPATPPTMTTFMTVLLHIEAGAATHT
jgi:hypothetical protein